MFRKVVHYCMLFLVSSPLYGQLFTKEISFNGLKNGNVAWADTDNDNDLDFAVCGYYEPNVTICILYKNLGSGVFEPAETHFTGVSDGTLTWFDYDNDDDVDLLITGSDQAITPVTKLYRNDRNDSFSEVNVQFPGFWKSSVDFGDYNNDGKIDLLLTGELINGDPRSIIYKNNGVSFEQINAKIDDVSMGSAKWCDLNNDRLLDILVTGRDLSANIHTVLYLNNGNDSFLPLTGLFKNIFHNSLDIGDFDSDGDQDIILAGHDYINHFERVYQNLGNNSYKITRIGMADSTPVAMYYSPYNRWGDFDNDGDLDILSDGFGTMGYTHGGYKIILNSDNTFKDSVLNIPRKDVNKIDIGDYDNDGDLDFVACNNPFYNSGSELFVSRNNSAIPNVKPSSPLVKKVTIIGSEVTLSWTQAKDFETLSAGLTYNLRIGRKKNNCDVVPSMSDIVTGFRRIVKRGNMGNDTIMRIKGLSPGKYYWAIQSIDNNYQGSLFSPIDSFIVNKPFTPIVTLTDANVLGTADIDNDNDLDLITSSIYNFYLQGMPDTAICKVYKNNGEGIFIQSDISLPKFRTDKFLWTDYNNDGFIDFFCSGRLFKNNNQLGFTEIRDSIKATGWGDFDNDGDPDLLGCSKVYINEGNDIFSEFNISTCGIDSDYLVLFNGAYRKDVGSYVWGDIDNDYEIELITTGLSLDLKPLCKVFKRNGSLFTETNLSIIPIVDNSSIELIDFDNDGKLDILEKGSGPAPDRYKYTLLYRNSPGDFAEIKTSIRGLLWGFTEAGDYNNDSFSDLLISGLSAIKLTRLYSNDKLDFSELPVYFDGYNLGKIQFANLDNDQDLDIILGSTIFTNNGDFPNNPPSSPTNLKARRTGYGIVFEWDSSIDPQGGSEGLSYNVRIGTTPGGFDIMSPMSDPKTGYRRIPEMGNVLLNKGWRVDSLPEGKYYWSVQAIDQGFMGGPWAPEQTFTISVVTANFEASTVCNGAATHFTDKSLSSASPITSWKWDFGDGSSSTEQNPSHTYASAGNYNVKLVVSSSQYSDSLVKTATVLPKATSAFTADPVCHGKPTVFQNTSQANGLAITSWEWDLGDKQTSSIQSPPEHFYAQPGSYRVKLKVSSDNGCSDTISKAVKVGEYPIVMLSASGPLEFCAGENVKLSVPKKADYLYQWNISDVPITDSTQARLTVINSGDYSVTVNNSVANCVSNSQKIAVNSTEKPGKPTIKNIGDVSGICEGTGQVALEVQQASVSYAYQWKIDGTPIDNATGVMLSKALYPGKYTVSASIKGCSMDSDPVNLNFIQALPKPILYVQGPVVWYMAASNDTAVMYKWYLNDALIEGADRYIYMANRTLGTYKVEIANREGCLTMSDEVTIPVSKGGMTKFDIPADFLRAENTDPFENLKIYPNPTPGLFTIEMDNNIFGELVIDIFNQGGSKILNIKFEKTTSHFKTQVDLSGQAKGMYVLNFILNKYFASRKLLVE